MAPDELEHIFNRFYRCDEARQLDHAGAQDVLTTSHFERMRDGAISVNAVGMDVDAGAVSAYAALLAERSGFRALYLSGAGVTDSVFGLPDLGMTTLTEVAEEARRICAATDLPLLVDADTGFGDAFGTERTEIPASLTTTPETFSPAP